MAGQWQAAARRRAAEFSGPIDFRTLGRRMGWTPTVDGVTLPRHPFDPDAPEPDRTAAVTALLDRLLHHAHVFKCGPRSWRTKVQTDLRTETAVR